MKQGRLLELYNTFNCQFCEKPSLGKEISRYFYDLRFNLKLDAPCSVLKSNMRNSAMLKFFVSYFQSFLGLNVVKLRVLCDV